MITINNSEVVVPEDKILVSKTDTKGAITYCNTAFIKISGYKEKELLGQNHNILRHPDMPRVIFKLMWESLKIGREFNGYIKNLTKDGGFYWVFANITPSLSEKNEVLGFQSACRKPNAETLNYIQNLYLELLEIEQQTTGTDITKDSLYKLNSILNAREMGYDEFVLSI